MQQPESATAYLHEHLPLTAAMGLTVARLADAVVELRLPLAPNLNHRHTVFGGSLSAAAITAGWALVHWRLRAEALPARVVIQGSTMDYLAPAHGETIVTCLVTDELWTPFATTLARKCRARLTLAMRLLVGEVLVATATGTYVALRPPLAPVEAIA